MSSPYHSGEIAVQERVGVRHMAARIGRSIGTTIPDVAQQFLTTQRMVVVASVDSAGRVWASLLTGAPGFLRAIGERTLAIDAAPVPGDPLAENLRVNAGVGLIAIEFASRRRMRLNGTARIRPEGGIVVEAQQVYANCPKYIQARAYQVNAACHAAPEAPRHSYALTRAQRQWVARADTFFIASAHPAGGADASHRGGNPGFVAVIDSRTLVFPDYAGNTMFNTLGNIAANPRAGLLFVDFDRGGTVQLTGTAEIVWDPDSIRRVAGAERLVEFRVEQALENAAAGLTRMKLVEYSPFNPA